MIKSIPIPTAGVSLGLAALGNLLQPYSPLMKYICGILAAVLLALLLIKMLRYPKLIHADMTGNPILGSVAATFFMTTMQLCVYIKDSAPFVCETIWLAAVAAHAILIIWFSKNFMLNLELKNVFPTFFIAYVGIVVASVTAPAFGYLTLGYYIFWFGFAAYMLLLALVTYRYLHHPIPEAAKPLICIYTAPMSLSLAGYFAVVPDKNFLLITVMQIAAQGLFFFILSLMPKLLRLPFYPSYAAFTFPFVITASALRLSLDYYARLGVVLHEFFQYIYYFECVVATFFVFYVTLHFCRFFYEEWKLSHSNV
ncbi:MAG: TDT family transporter [Phascolarctobacterium sp.]|uniref:TDT family transporter n=1 Tax=Phascolarctobacterium sp. TaxID=2049039 RepID=UPI0025D2C8DE|nr:TDT family transporter [Phascolarctobacterium sp.]MCC8157964.1 TDT family transporter [Phascolarctobacterium sp.]